MGSRKEMMSHLNQGSQIATKATAVQINCNAARGLMEVLKSNLGPKGTIKMLVGGAGQIKLTKDGCVLLGEMQIQHPTASLIARAATAQDDITGDGTTTTVLLIGETFKLAVRHMEERVHPRVIVDGLDKAKAEACRWLIDGDFKKSLQETDADFRQVLTQVAYTSLATKVGYSVAEDLSRHMVDAVLCIQKKPEPIDLHMVEIMHMQHKQATDTSFIRGLVLDHGSRHPDMPKQLKNCYILTCNVSLEWERSEVTANWMYSSAEQRDKMADAEKRVVVDKCRQIIALKRQLCTEENGKSFVVINQKGIEPIALEMLARENIIGLRRAKRRNMERLTLACGGTALNDLADMTEADLGYADEVYEHVLGDEKYTFVTGVRDPHSCTILIKGPNPHTIAQVKDSVRDGLRAVKNAIEDGNVVPGAGAFEIALHKHLMEWSKTIPGHSVIGVTTFANALLVVPKTLAENSGLDPLPTLLDLQNAKGPVGLDITSGKPLLPAQAGIWDNYSVKLQLMQSAPLICGQLLLVDEILKAGRGMSKD